MDVAAQPLDVHVLGVERRQVVGLAPRLGEIAERRERSGAGDARGRVVDARHLESGAGEQLFDRLQAAPRPSLPQVGGGQAFAHPRVARMAVEQGLEVRLPGRGAVLEEEQPPPLDLRRELLAGDLRELGRGRPRRRRSAVARSSPSRGRARAAESRPARRQRSGRAPPPPPAGAAPGRRRRRRCAASREHRRGAPPSPTGRPTSAMRSARR